MKKKLLWGIAALALACSSVNAGYLRIDTEEDVERVSNNVRVFWEQHPEELDVFLNKKTDKYKESLSSIIQSREDLIVNIKRYPKATLEDIEVSLLFFNNKQDEPNEADMTTKNGLILIRNIARFLGKK